MIDMGAKFAWFFTYMPIGAAAVPELIATAEQRKFMYEQIHKFRKTSPSLRWTSGTTATRSAAASPVDAATATSMPTATWSPAHSFTTPIPTSKKKRCLSATVPALYGLSPQPALQRKHAAPRPVLDNPGRLTQIVENPVPVPRILKAPSAPAITATAASPPLKSGRRLPMSCGIPLPKKKGVQLTGKMAKNPDGKQSVWTICWYRIPIPACACKVTCAENQMHIFGESTSNPAARRGCRRTRYDPDTASFSAQCF